MVSKVHLSVDDEAEQQQAAFERQRGLFAWRRIAPGWVRWKIENRKAMVAADEAKRETRRARREARDQARALKPLICPGPATSPRGDHDDISISDH
jgi:hypothetical protein